MLQPQEAIQRLQEGNKRYVSDNGQGSALTNQARRSEVASGQAPFAIILSCADSRVPVEMLFDQGLGDLFVVRVAGNIATPTQIGSIEFAATAFGTPLIIVLGHSRCGAITQTLAAVEDPSAELSPNLESLAEEIAPTIRDLISTPAAADRDTLIAEAVRANVRHSITQLTGRSEILQQLVDSNKLTIVGAEYSLDTGAVDFFQESGEMA